VTTLILDKSLAKGTVPNYDKYIRFLSIVSFVSLFVFALCLELNLEDNNKILIYAICVLIGVGFQAFTPVAA